jgi:DNA-binding transcriptional regulator GbsR (MarR family)
MPQDPPIRDRMTDTARPSDEQLLVIEDFGLVFEAHGMPRMAGRILGRLLMCDPPHQSMNQLAEALGASKGSVSTMSRLLIDKGMVERLCFPGDRHDYFRVRSGTTSDMFRDQMRHAKAQLDLFERAMLVADDRSDEGLRRLRDAHDFFAFIQREIPELLRRWEITRATDDNGLPKED